MTLTRFYWKARSVAQRLAFEISLLTLAACMTVLLFGAVWLIQNP